MPRGVGKERAAWSLDDLADHCRTGAFPDLTRTRRVFEFGESEVGRRFDDARRESLAHGAARDALIAELRDGTGRSVEPGLSSLDDMRGGLRDVERAARLLRLTHTENDPDDPAPTAASVFRGAGAGRLADAATLWRGLRGILRLVGGDGFAAEAAGPKVKAAVARACGAEDFDALTAAVRDTAASASAEIDILVGRNVSPAGSDAGSEASGPS